MKSKLALMAGLGVLAAATPASAGRTPSEFTTFEDCAAVAAAVTSKAWIASCAPDGQGGWKIVYTHKRHMG